MVKDTWWLNWSFFPYPYGMSIQGPYSGTFDFQPCFLRICDQIQNVLFSYNHIFILIVDGLDKLVNVGESSFIQV